MHIDGRKSLRILSQAACGLIALAAISACERAIEDQSAPVAKLPAVEPGCGSDGRLSAELYGSIEQAVDWSADVLDCQSMQRPDGAGVRIRFTGPAQNRRLAIILAMPELARGTVVAESPTVVTLTVEGSGRFFSTPSLESCWTDIATQDPVDDSGDRYRLSGTLFCVTPLGEVNGNAAISIPRLEFRGILDWSVT
ncbi:MAG: hypothetical protein KJO46_03450 [Gammaproteobacteria bacterium]|nr:hypothetical protein [Gammaproteobacteria bacterium]